LDTASADPTIGQSLALAGQIALVTGASSGLGRRFAKVLAGAGATVAAAGRRDSAIAETVNQIRSNGGVALGCTMDVTNADSIVRGMDSIQKEVGPIQILVNNAGVPDAQRAHRMSVELVDRVINTNLRGPYLLSIEFARRLIERQLPGRIVNISSMGAFEYGGNGAALYSTTKAAINRMTETLAVEWARYMINVNAIAPGAFASEMMDAMLERTGDITAGFPRGRLGDPSQLDSTLLYLTASASEFVTGTIIKVDDGQEHR
jgi:NAD(P)-dependent dehydrogenase (short-subunit alcohol dehydrogenase family)